MANEEHLEILRGGVDRWNQWRKENLAVRPDFSDADLSGANFHSADFHSANFSNANLHSTKLIYANLVRVNLHNANLIDANLSYADLRHANLIDANLSYADLRSANFLYADSRNANLSYANLNSAGLNHTDLSRANLTGAKFVEADLSQARFHLSNLTCAKLARADLSNADFEKANLSNAELILATLIGTNFTKANLTEAGLTGTQALATNFEGAILTGACIEDWNVHQETNFNDVICDYFYRKNQQQERRPSDRNKIFAPGDFAKLARKSLETVDLIFSNGIDWKAFFVSLEDLQVEYEGQDLSIQAIENKNDGSFVIRLNVAPDSDKGAIERRYWEMYEPRLKAQEERLALQGEQLMFYREQVEIERKNNTNLQGVIKTMAENQSSKVTQNFHAPIGGVAGNVEGDMNVYSPEQRQTLAEAAKEIQQLLEQLSQTYPITTQAEKFAVATKAAEEIEANPALRSRVIGALKAGGVETLKELVDHPAVNILLALVEGWKNPE